MGEIGAWIVALAGLAIFMAMNIRLAVRISAVDEKADVTWAFIMRRAKSEAVLRGWATVNSPIQITEEAKRLVAGLIGPIRQFYAALGRRQITENELAMEIERRFGDLVLDDICIPFGMTLGACLLIVIAELKSPSTPA